MNCKCLVAVFIGVSIVTTSVAEDPCGMVPPIYTGPGSPIARVGLQQTYVFYKDGIESFVIRPGFTGKVDNFGMLIPFPTPPAIRKVPDQTFQHLAAAVDPPEVEINLRPVRLLAMTANAAAPGSDGLAVRHDTVRVLRTEAVGMYEVAVLEAGSAAALKRWMDQNGYQYPDGMDAVTEDYVEIGWCFVAVKTRVGEKSAADPQPGQRRVRSDMPAGGGFDGHVQGMGFRFKTDELVVPMRLSAFNKGELRNVVYLLTDGPKKIRSIPEEFVVRQLDGSKIKRNLTEPLPLRVLGGTLDDAIRSRTPQFIKNLRDPVPKNGIARELFTADLLAVESGRLSLGHEETEKELLQVGEHFGMRGDSIDRENAGGLADARKKTSSQGLDLLDRMTLTVVDGDFPREVLANQNLTFAQYEMPAARNRPSLYDANRNGPAIKKEGNLYIGALSAPKDRTRISSRLTVPVFAGLGGIIGCMMIIAGIASSRHSRKRMARNRGNDSMGQRF